MNGPEEKKPAHVLIVEDSPTQAEGVRHVLQQQGYTTSVAKNGKEALEYMLEQKPDIIISDIIMPEMDGFDLCRKIKSREGLKDTPVILLTSLSDAADVLKGLESGADNFITKPYTPPSLISHIESALAISRNGIKPKAEKSVDIIFENQKFSITSGREHILELLLSTYETAVIKNRELQAAQQELKHINVSLQAEVIERKAVQEALNQSLEDKKILLKELYHRTKNNMHAISNLLALQSGSIKDPEVRQMLKETQGRIHSMALVHEMLYKTMELSKLDLKDYLEQLARSVVGSYKKTKVLLKLDLDPVLVPLDVAMPCGLIINELLTNSLKHAFPAGEGQISISLRAAEGKIELTHSDNGRGFPEAFNVEEATSLGMKLVRALVNQLLGTMEIKDGNGAVIVLRFDLSSVYNL